jgi:MFS family permease
MRPEMRPDPQRTSPESPNVEPTHGSVRPLALLVRKRDFRRLFVGNSVSLLGSSVTAVALPLTAVVYLHASSTQMGFLGAAALLPHLVLGLPAGVWVDRLPYRGILVTADLTQMLMIGAVPVLAVLGVLEIWHLYVVVIIAGVANLFETVTAQSFTPLLVSRQKLLPANSTLMLSNATVNTTGSALGGLLVTALTAPIAVVVDALSFLVAGVLKARISVAGRIVVDLPRKQHMLADVREGLQVVFSHRIIRAVIIAATVSAFAGQFQAVVLVLYLVQDIGLSSALVGVVVAVSGIAGVLGALVATSVTHRLGPGPAFITGMFLASVGGLILAAAGGPFAAAFTIVVVAQLLRGAGPSLYGVNQQTFRQVLIPPPLLARANATWRFLAYGSQSLGALVGGWLGATVGLNATLVVSSCVMLAGTSIAFMSPVRSLRDLS